MEVSTRIPTKESRPTDRMASFVFKVTVLGSDTIKHSLIDNWRILDSSPSPIGHVVKPVK
jgi:hypothetical protein